MGLSGPLTEPVRGCRSVSSGILTSTMARTSQQVLFIFYFILIFFILLSGFFIPIENLPSWVQVIGKPGTLFHGSSKGDFLLRVQDLQTFGGRRYL